MAGAGRVVAFGDVIDDILVLPAGPVRVDTDTPSTIRRLPGGSASNVASWLGSFGVATDFIGMVSATDIDRHSAEFARAGVTPHLTAHPELPTGAIVVLVDGERRTMFTERGANSALHPGTVTDGMLNEAALLHLTGYSVIDSPDPAALRHLIARARDRGVDVSVDPGSAGYLVDYGVARFLDAVGEANLLFPSLDEAQLITGESDPHVSVTALAAHFDVVALTMGPGGVLVGTGAAIAAIPAVAASVIDPTGAGDAFDAGFIQSWIARHDAEAAARAGVRLAARAVASVGGRPRGADRNAGVSR